MNLESMACVVGSTIALCVCTGYVVTQVNDLEIAKTAVAAGLVQQVVNIPSYCPRTIWVKPPALPLVEGTK